MGDLAVTDARSPGSPTPLDVLGGVADALADGGDLDGTLRALLAIVTRQLAADSAAVFIQDPDRVGLEPAVAVGIDEAAFGRLRETLGRDDDPVAATARDRAARVTSGGTGGYVTTTGSRSAAFEPLVVTRGGIELTLGVLAVGWRHDRALTPDEAATLRALARLTGVAVDHGRLASLVAERSEWFERMAQSDPLTGLANKRAFARVLELELARAVRQGTEVSLALFDVDGFVATNETAGHAAGDDVLRRIASVLNEAVRMVDTVGRIGGDEFVLVLPGSAGMTVARRVLSGVSKLEPVAGRPISLSAGVATFPVDGSTTDELLAAALAALNEAKGRGAGTLHEAGVRPAG